MDLYELVWNLYRHVWLVVVDERVYFHLWIPLMYEMPVMLIVIYEMCVMFIVIYMNCL